MVNKCWLKYVKCWNADGIVNDDVIKWNTFASLALCAGNSPVNDEFPSQRPVTQSFDVFFDLRLNKRLNNQSWDWWLEAPSRSLWRQCNVLKRPVFYLNFTCIRLAVHIWLYVYYHCLIIHNRFWIGGELAWLSGRASPQIVYSLRHNFVSNFIGTVSSQDLMGVQSPGSLQPDSVEYAHSGGSRCLWNLTCFDSEPSSFVMMMMMMMKIMITIIVLIII